METSGHAEKQKHLNRDATGLERTPPSLAWLIWQRSVLQGELERRQEKLADQMEVAECTAGEVAALEAQISALDSLFRLHDVKIEPANVAPTRVHELLRLGPHGTLTRYLLRTLREAGADPVFTSQLALGYMKERGMEPGQMPLAKINRRVKTRLQGLSRAGIVQRHHDLETQSQGRWTLLLDEDAERQAA